MGGKSSKTKVVKNEIPTSGHSIATSGHSIARAPYSGRGTSTSPSEAWEDNDWFNNTNSSYNLLDFQVGTYAPCKKLKYRVSCT